MNTITVTNADELVAALNNATGGETILAESGSYGHINLEGFHVAAGKSGLDFAETVTIKSADTDNPAEFGGFYISGVTNLTIDSVKINVTEEVAESVGWKAIGTYVNNHSSGITISNSEITGNSIQGDINNLGYDGILVRGNSSNIIIENNDIHHTRFGSGVQDATDVIVRGNHYSDNMGDNSRYGTNVENILVEENTFMTLDPSNVINTHQDHIQFWNHSATSSDNITIQGNTIIQEEGITQSIFMRGDYNLEEGVAGGYSNVTIEDNFIYNGHVHGIMISYSDAVNIQNNTLLANGELDSGGTAPAITVSETSNASAANNITNKLNLGDEVVNDNNVIIQRTDPAGDNFYGDLFVNIMTDEAITLEDLALLPDSDLANAGTGALPRVTFDDMTALFSHEQTYGETELVFDAAISVGVDGLPLEGATYTWEFADGTVKEGVQVAHNMGDGGTQQVTLTVDDGHGNVDILTKTIVMLHAHTVSMDMNGVLVDGTAEETTAAWIGTEQYVDTGDGMGALLEAGSYINLERDTELFNTQEMTFSIAFKPDEDMSGSNAFLYYNTTKVLFSLRNGDEVRLYIEGEWHTFEGVGYMDGQEHHIAFTFNHGEVTLYFDGKAIDSHIYAADTITEKEFWDPRVGLGFEGYLKDLEIYRDALSSEDIATLHAGGAHPEPEDLYLEGTGAGDALQGLEGNDLIEGGNGKDMLLGGAGDDVIKGQVHADTLDGGAGNDTLVGGHDRDKLIGGSGADTFVINDINDSASLKFDTVLGFEMGIDVLDLSAMGYSALVEAGTASIVGQLEYLMQDGDVTVYDPFSTFNVLLKDVEGVFDTSAILLADHTMGTTGDDSIIYTFLDHEPDESFVLNLQNGNDYVAIQSYAGDVIDAGVGDDYILSGHGADVVYGGDGDDYIDGQVHRDSLNGNAGNDTLIGGHDRDVLVGGSGNNQLTGGDHADLFVFDYGNDTITDFQTGLDQIDLTAAMYSWVELTDAINVTADGDTAIDLGDYSLTLLGVSAVSENDFIL